MFPHSTILGPLFWIGMGLLYALIIVGARIWAQDLGLKMTWWKWLLTAIWYILLSVSISGAFTLFGENESRAGYYFLGIFVTITVILGAGLWRILLAGIKK